jgi:hypothetical protein
MCRRITTTTHKIKPNRKLALNVTPYTGLNGNHPEIDYISAFETAIFLSAISFGTDCSHWDISFGKYEYNKLKHRNTSTVSCPFIL